MRFKVTGTAVRFKVTGTAVSCIRCHATRGWKRVLKAVWACVMMGFYSKNISTMRSRWSCFAVRPGVQAPSIKAAAWCYVVACALRYGCGIRVRSARAPARPSQCHV